MQKLLCVLGIPRCAEGVEGVLGTARKLGGIRPVYLFGKRVVGSFGEVV